MAFRFSALRDICCSVVWGTITRIARVRHGQLDDGVAGDAGARRPQNLGEIQGAGKMRTSDEGISLIRHFEGCSLGAYLCPAGVWTIGYGHTREVKEGDVINREQAEALLIEDLEEFEGYVNSMVEVALKQNEFDALVSWVFNLGPGNFKESTLLNRVNYGPMSDVPHQIQRWNKAGGKILEGLVKRRAAEAALWEGKAWREGA